MAKILIIDDDAVLCDALSALFSAEGHKVQCECDGAGGLAAFKAGRPDLVILDRAMPGLSGSETLARIMDEAPDARVLVLSAYDSRMDAESYIAAGAAAFVSKREGLKALADEVGRLAGSKAAAGKAGTARAPAPRRGGVLLVADDDKFIVDIVGKLFSGAGYSVLKAYDGEAALALARSSKPDIVMLDITMPKKDGTEVLRALTREMPSTGFMMITGNDDEELARDCLRYGAFDYIAKPLNLQVLERVVKARLLVQGR